MWNPQGKRNTLWLPGYPDLNAELARVSSQLREEAARLAIEKALSTLPGKLDTNAQAKFMSQAIKDMGDN